MFAYRGKTALVTGASAGIGAEFARALAARGSDVILVARSQERLRALADELARDFGVRAEVIAADLTRADAARDLYAEAEVRGLTVDLLINNAGFGTHGPFETLAPARDHAEVMLNVAAVVDLTHLFLPAMLKRGDGAVINVASTASFQPVPYMAVYGATKAFVLSFSEALWAECRGRGVRVLALCPGTTATEFFDVVGTQDAGRGDRRQAHPRAGGGHGAARAGARPALRCRRRGQLPAGADGAPGAAKCHGAGDGTHDAPAPGSVGHLATRLALPHSR